MTTIHPKNSLDVRRKWLYVAVFALILAILAVLTIVFSSNAQAKLDFTSPAEFVGRSACVECHKKQADDFHGSHHDMAMDVANATTVRANFDDQSLEHFGLTSTFFRKDGNYFVNTEGPDGKMQDFEVKYVFGYEPLQQYMVELRPSTSGATDTIGQLQVLRLCWDTIGKRWFYLTPPDVDTKLEPDDPLHWTGITMRWNTACADCHSTNLQKNFESLSQTYNTKFSEIDVSCEACHGPGSQHVELEKTRNWFSTRRESGLFSLKNADALTQVEMCATCHSRRNAIRDGFHVSDRYSDHFSCELLMDHTYHGDGQIKDEVYVYGSFVQSKMFHKGIRCTDCHDPHTTRIKRPGNTLCTGCHQHPAARYDSPNHHHHAVGSSGSLCVECHMPTTTYMEVDPRRDHSLRVPRPDLSVKYGTPNACTGCHIELEKLPIESRMKLRQYSDWILHAKDDTPIRDELARIDNLMLAAIGEWYQTEYDNDHYYAQFAAGSIKSPNTETILSTLANDKSAPTIIRASSLQRMGDSRSKESLEASLSGLKSNDPGIVVGSLPRIESELGRILDYMQYVKNDSDLRSELRGLLSVLAEQLKHPVLETRIRVAQTLTIIPLPIRSEMLDADQREHFSAAAEELIKSLRLHEDIATNHAVIAGVQQALDPEFVVEPILRRGIALSPNGFGLRTQLASELGRRQVAIQRAAIQAQRQQDAKSATRLQNEYLNLSAEIQQLRDYDHQLLLADLEVTEQFEGRQAVYHQLAMSYYLRGETEKTHEFLMKAFETDTSNERTILALTTLFKAQNNWVQAQEFMDKLLAIDSNHPGYQALATEIKQHLSADNSENQKEQK